MEIEATAEDFVQWIADALRSEPERAGDKIRFRLKHGRDAEEGPPLPLISTTQTHIESALERLAEKEALDEIGICDESHYEILVKQEAPYPLYRSRVGRGDFDINDHENQVTYRICRPSDELLLLIIYKLSHLAPLTASLGRYPLGHRLSRRREREETELKAFDMLRQASPQLLTLRIVSQEKRTSREFEQFANSLFFQLSYNLDTALVPQRSLDELVRRGRIGQLRQVGVDEVAAPKLTYTPDLVYHYQLAVAADNPPLEYLSLYHIAEHFFKTVFEEDLLERVQDMLVQPGFSSKRRGDISKVIKEVKNSVLVQHEEVVFSEQQALILTLHRYGVEPGDLVEQLREYDETLIDYYRKEEVVFCHGDRVHLEGDDKSEVLRALARRIYKTRNAIVHSKEGEKGRYIPFQHDRVLAKELPLLRFVAEAIILSDSRPFR
jgi:hypothetical protein